MECFAYRVQTGGRNLVYSGDTTLCDGLLSLVSDAGVVVIECSCDGVPVHLHPEGVEAVVRHAPPHAQFILTHLDGRQDADPLIQRLTRDPRFHVAADLARFRF
jgi:ribonuclease BN (tRNA processing enzyme)